MPIIEPIIRPPSEANSFLLQVTLGCSANACTFCGAYQNKPYRVKPKEEIRRDIDRFARARPQTRKAFLMDGDALSLKSETLLFVLDHLNRRLPELNRVSAYANDYSILNKSTVELDALRARKLRLMYMGLESGCQEILDRCRKKSTAAGMTEAVIKAGASGIKSDIIVLLGLGGRELSGVHVQKTADVLNAMRPDYLAFLSLMLIPGTPLYVQAREGGFQELTPNELLAEMRGIVQGLELKKTWLRASHASNYLAIEGRLPRDKQSVLAMIDRALRGLVPLRPEIFRGL